MTFVHLGEGLFLFCAMGLLFIGFVALPPCAVRVRTAGVPSGYRGVGDGPSNTSHGKTVKKCFKGLWLLSLREKKIVKMSLILTFLGAKKHVKKSATLISR